MPLFRLFSLFCLFLTLAAAAPAAAQISGVPVQAPRVFHTSAEIFSPVTATGDQDTVPAALRIRMEGNWKIYWRTPGDAGLPPALDWSGSQNLADTHIYWPVPFRFTIFDIDNIGYKHEAVFPLDLTLAEAGAPLALQLKLDLLVCDDICVPETHHLTFNLPAGPATPSAQAEDYAQAKTLLPVPAHDGARFDRIWLDYDSGNRSYLVAEMTVAEKPANDVDLFIEHPAAVVFGKPAVKHDAKTGTLVLRAPVHSSEPLDKIQADLASGEIMLTYASGTKGTEGALALSPRPANAPVMSSAATRDKLAAFDYKILLFALLGGLILNLMPCVLPVLSLKILSVVSHGGKDNRTTVFKNFMASAAGIIFSFWIIAGALALMKSAGQTIGWGIQFQHPGFLVFLTVVVLLFAANMWGLFEIPLPRFIARHATPKAADEPTLAGHFLTGAFATLLATPCTAPFLGTAIGFALARGTFEIFTIFTFLGIGLALPYILLAVSPGVFKYMPRPGAWMVRLRKVLALALVATAVWLCSILFTITTTAALAKGWEKFDQPRIAVELAAGRTVFIDVTADWCLTCKANKRFVLERQDVQMALSAENVVRLQADWTQRDETIAAYLQSYGKYGIPFNIVYGPGAPEGIVLPELLTQEAVLHALAEAAGE
ncbi:MAG: protein-disulfide reductase DsbD family protein [Alphaproteobacteria bacterium]